ncbi:MAG: hypothetical protein NT163_04525 [Chlorobiales bacterium]|nr:hypothetical protein [Chlorobiales bacterium]
MNDSNMTQLLELATSDPIACLDIVIPLMNKLPPDSRNPLLSYIAGHAYMNTVVPVIVSDERYESQEMIVDLCKAALTHLRDAGDLNEQINEVLFTDDQIVPRVDVMCNFLEQNAPGLSSKIWRTIKLRYLGAMVFFHPLKEKEAKELLDVTFPCPSNVRCALVVGGGDGTMIAALSDVENYWGIDADERSSENLLGSVTFAKQADGQWSYLSSSVNASEN